MWTDALHLMIALRNSPILSRYLAHRQSDCKHSSSLDGNLAAGLLGTSVNPGGCHVAEQTQQLGRLSEGTAQPRKIVRINDQGRSLESALVIVVAESDLQRPLRLPFREAKKLDCRHVILGFDLHLFFDKPASPRKLEGLLLRVLFSHEVSYYAR